MTGPTPGPGSWSPRAGPAQDTPERAARRVIGPLHVDVIQTGVGTYPFRVAGQHLHSADFVWISTHTFKARHRPRSATAEWSALHQMLDQPAHMRALLAAAHTCTTTAPRPFTRPFTRSFTRGRVLRRALRRAPRAPQPDPNLASLNTAELADTTAPLFALPPDVTEALTHALDQLPASQPLALSEVLDLSRALQAS